MSQHEEENKQSFKVVDKRGMMEEDEGCCGGHDHHHHHDGDDHHEHDSEDGEPMAISFSMFVQSFAHQTMMGLGMAPWPDGPTRVELGFAKETIDILAMLKDKTKNNLSEEEQLLIDSLLYQLQMSYVEILKAPQGGSPIIK